MMCMDIDIDSQVNGEWNNILHVLQSQFVFNRAQSQVVTVELHWI